MFAILLFWIFQLLNGATSLALVIAPRKFHETTFKEPERVYQELGFSTTALGMLHNVLRGQGAALLSITVFLFFLGAEDRSSFLLIAITCLLSLIAHVLTYQHHIRDEMVRKTLGDSLKSIYVLIAVNLIIGGTALGIFFSWR